MSPVKVLWFSVTPSLYESKISGHNGGGWIASLESLVRGSGDVQLAVAFEHEDGQFKVEDGDVTYYPINVWTSKAKKLKRRINLNIEEELLIPACLRVIEDFKPDVIHVFGSEWCFGLIAQHINIPLIIHMQGSIPPYFNARFPVGYNNLDLIRFNGVNLIRTILDFYNEKNFRLRAKREEKILRSCQYFMGRTEWDRSIVSLYNPSARYFYCSEALRQVFFEEGGRIWNKQKRSDFIITTTISAPLYKGVDLVLKTAKLLMDNGFKAFKWRVFGLSNVKFHEWKTKIASAEVNVEVVGTVSAEKLKDELLNSDVFVHPSYIDNSPNSVCEAQLLGMPVISTNVGGISSLVSHRESGLLVPANDPFLLASYIKTVLCNDELATYLGRQGRKEALLRHDGGTLLNNLINIYKSVLDEKSV
ncbi:glycosyltransferase [Pararcticibacter amylolyticus]|uniref:Glycosyl transferase family 1 domain-containing protein n=1 Tax=Pararcticibacter amylolyticus TaxID=2173175 RepID=A0A2U2PBJ3_9SPHI|nr:glycosyltransferase [Pararcticibacter amylolyticus]PWG78725.1 hypothetical protein DDR33_21125 [Pararcticibacter amylolyticus]